MFKPVSISSTTAINFRDTFSIFKGHNILDTF